MIDRSNMLQEMIPNKSNYISSGRRIFSLQQSIMQIFPIELLICLEDNIATSGVKKLRGTWLA